MSGFRCLAGMPCRRLREGKNGDVSPAEMRPEALTSADVRRIAGKVSVSEDAMINADFPRLRSAGIDISFDDGTTLETYVDAPIGMPENPVGWVELEGKFRAAADGLLSRDRQGSVLEAIGCLDTSASLSDLTRLLRKE